jgi:hypothetical protein
MGGVKAYTGTIDYSAAGKSDTSTSALSYDTILEFECMARITDDSPAGLSFP